MGEAYPPSTHAQSPQFRIGRDHLGHWVVQDDRGLTGGLFVSRAEALKFALFENGNHPQAVIMMPGPLELDIAPHGKWPAPKTDTSRISRAA